MFLLKIILVCCLFIVTPLFSATKLKKQKTAPVREYIYYEKGMRHHLVVGNKKNNSGTFAKGAEQFTIIDTIQHANLNIPDEQQYWSDDIQGYTVAGDTLTNWYWFASDTARILEIHASFRSTGTGTWNVWEGVYLEGSGVIPNTGRSFLLLNIPWTIETADIAQQQPTREWQVLDLDVLEAEIPRAGAFVGYFTGSNSGPFMFMDDGNHALDDFSWYPSRTYLSSYPTEDGSPPWYFWATPDNWTEYVQRIVVSYTHVAPLIEKISDVPDFMAGNPEYANVDVQARVEDIDGTVASVSLNWAVGPNGSPSSVPMVAVNDTLYSGTINTPLPGGEIVFYWISATDGDGNSRDSFDKNFRVAELPSGGTDYLLVNENGRLGVEVFQEVLQSLGKNYYTWDIDARGQISDYEINQDYGSIIWTGFGSGFMPSPFETGPHPVKTALDNGKNLLLIDNDYLYIHDFESDTLQSGMFAYDYLGLYSGVSDPLIGDSIHVGITGDPISNVFSIEDNELVTYPAKKEIWSEGDIGVNYSTEWQDLLVPRDQSNPVFYNSYWNTENNYNTAIRYFSGNSAVVFFAFSVETAGFLSFYNVISNTLDWMDSVNPTDINNAQQSLSGFELAQNYPNPFNPQTIISYKLPGAAKVTLTVFDAAGRKIKTLLNKNQPAGDYTVSFDASHLTSGIYFYRINTSAGFAQTRKMVFIK